MKKEELLDTDIHLNVRGWVPDGVADFPPLKCVEETGIWHKSEYEQFRQYLLTPNKVELAIHADAGRHLVNHDDRDGTSRSMVVTGIADMVDADTRQTNFACILALLTGTPPFTGCRIYSARADEFMVLSFPVLSDADIGQIVQDIAGYVNKGSQLIAIGTRKELHALSTACTTDDVGIGDMRRYHYYTSAAKVPRESGYSIGDLNIVSTVQPTSPSMSWSPLSPGR